MKKLKPIVHLLPELFLIGSVVFYWGSAGWGLNPIGIGLLLVLGFQLIFKNRIVGLILPVLLTLICLYMILALISEFNEFESINHEARQLIFIGLTYFITTIAVSGFMFFKYALQEK